MARCLVIGANGFLGSHLTDRLADAGHEVTAFDRFSRGTVAFSHTRVAMARGDFLSAADLRAALTGQDYVFHFLSLTTPIAVDNEPTLDIRTNVLQSISLMELAVEAGVQRFYFASSGGTVYGPQDLGMYQEDAPRRPLSPYGIGKMTVESYLEYFGTKHNLRSIVLRIANPFGPRQNPQGAQGLIPIALGKVQRGQPVVRLGDGSMVRDYIFVEDLTARILRMVDGDPIHQVYNLGSGAGYSVNEILEAIHKVVGADFSIEQMPAPLTFVDTVVLDTDRYRSEFGEHNDLPLTEGIRMTWDYLRAGGIEA